MLIAAFVMALSCASVHAAEHTLIMHHMELEEMPVPVKVGDVITFDNRSDMTHNLYLTYSDGTVDNLDTQVPGMQRKLTLRVAGPAVIKCWIHPIIRLEVDIGPEEAPANP
jgi:plastocyanin